MHNMVYARIADVYEANRQLLRTLCVWVGFESFYEYCERNWHSSIDLWVLSKRARLPHFRNHTNNRF